MCLLELFFSDNIEVLGFLVLFWYCCVYIVILVVGFDNVCFSVVIVVVLMFIWCRFLLEKMLNFDFCYDFVVFSIFFIGMLIVLIVVGLVW